MSGNETELEPWYKRVKGPFPERYGCVGVKEDGGGSMRGRGTVGKMRVHRATFNRNAALVRELCANGEDVNEVDENGDPLLDADGNQIVTPGLKSQYIAATKATQGSLLAETDWAYIRKTDTGIAVPDDIQTYRTAVRLAAGVIEGQIAACATLDAFKALFVVPETGNAPIHNWPDPI